MRGLVLPTTCMEGWLVILCRISGYSMYPLLRQGRKVLLKPIAQPHELRVGDVVACRPGAGEPAIHRVVKIADDGRLFITKGDNCRRSDPTWKLSQALGVMVAAEDAGGAWCEPRPCVARLFVTGQRWGFVRILRFFFRFFPGLGWRRVAGRRKWLVEDETSGMVFLIDSATQSRHSLTPVAREIWEYLHEGKSEAEIVQALHDVYTNIPAEELRADVSRTISDFRRLKLI